MRKDNNNYIKLDTHNNNKKREEGADEENWRLEVEVEDLGGQKGFHGDL
jgi:hypothetical protein